ncbi:spore germination protein [Paenibacillus chartarius]|uniref:Spore germination protein n=1 Tax=Paenibacillus chartarius TaxID=747481 RepID=A0ABV6DE52_9BACL
MQQTNSTIDWICSKLSEASDIVISSIRNEQMEGRILYIRTVCDETKLQKLIIDPLGKFPDFPSYARHLLSLPGVQLPFSNEETLNQVLKGCVLIAIESHTYLLDMKDIQNAQVSETNVESTFLGPKLALSEDVSINIGLIRLRYPRPSLSVQEMTVGKLSCTRMVIMYDDDFVNREALQRVREALASVDLNLVQSASQLMLAINGSKRSAFPKGMVTERPDRIVYNLAVGKIAVLLQGTPFAVIVPTVLFDFMSSMDDVYENYAISRFLVLLRYIGLLFSLTLASFYVVVTSFNPEILRVQLALSIAGSRAPVPYPSYVEVLFMLIMMELLTEASVRLPKTVGSTATTVGGLILGQAATQAGLVSNIMIIIVAAVAISNFVVPIIPMGFGMRVAKYFILLLSSMFGFMGLLVGLVFLVVYIAMIDSFGTPYLQITWGLDSAKLVSQRLRGEAGGRAS